MLGGSQADYYFAGIVVAWVSFAVAMWFVYRLACLDLRADQALRAVFFAAMLPAAYFFGMVYSESLFLLALTGAVLALRERRWAWAAVAGAAMTLTRVPGVMFVPALVWLAWRGARDARERRIAVSAAAASLTGIASYLAYNYMLSGDPLAWYYSIQRWEYYPGGNPFAGLVRVGHALWTRPYTYLATEPMAPYDVLNTLSAVAALVAAPFVWRRFGGPYAAIIVLGLVLPLSSGQTEGLGRYCTVLFPLPLLLASIDGEARQVTLIAATAMLYTLGLILFVNVHPLY